MLETMTESQPVRQANLQPMEERRRDEATEAVAPSEFEVRNLSVWYGAKKAIDHVSINIPAKSITAIIGPSGCGKSTFLRCLNRMHELVPNTRIEGRVLFEGNNLYGPGVDPTLIRRRIGMVFQKSNPFPTMSIQDNVVVGLRLNGVRN